MILRLRTFSAAIFAGMILSGCGGDAPRPTAVNSGPAYKIVSEMPDAKSRSTTVIVAVPATSTPVEIKAMAESVVAARKGQFDHITVKSFIEGTDLDGVPLAVSKYEGGGIDHVFTGLSPPSQRIPTH